MICYYCGVKPRVDKEACSTCAARWKKPLPPKVLSVKAIKIAGTLADFGMTVAGVPLNRGFVEDGMPDVPMRVGQIWQNPKGKQQRVKDVIGTRLVRVALMYPRNGSTWQPQEWPSVALNPDDVPEEKGWSLVI